MLRNSFPPKSFDIDYELKALRRDAVKKLADEREEQRVLLPSLLTLVLAIVAACWLPSGKWFAGGVAASLVVFLVSIWTMTRLNRYLADRELQIKVSDRELLDADLEKNAREAHSTITAEATAAKYLVADAMENGLLSRGIGWTMYDALGKLPDDGQKKWSEYAASARAQLTAKQSA